MTHREEQLKELMDGVRRFHQHVAFSSVHTENAPHITSAQWRVLLFLERHGETTVKDVAEAFHITSSAATQLVSGLVKSGYAERHQHAKDRRAVVLTLSQKTHTHVEKMKKQNMKKMISFFEVLTDKEFNEYIRLNQKMIKHLAEKRENKKK